MRTPKYYLYLTDEEYSLVLQSLVSLKNNLIREDRYTDAVDELKALTVNTITNSILQSVIFVLFFIPPPPYIKLSSNNSPTTMPSLAAKIITAIVMPILMNTFFLFLSIQCSRFYYYFTGIYLSRYSSIF